MHWGLSLIPGQLIQVRLSGAYSCVVHCIGRWLARRLGGPLPTLWVVCADLRLEDAVDPTDARNELVSRYATPSAFRNSVQPMVRKSSRNSSVHEFSRLEAGLFTGAQPAGLADD